MRHVTAGQDPSRAGCFKVRLPGEQLGPVLGVRLHRVFHFVFAPAPRAQSDEPSR